jgi:hypothetical protein
LLGLMWLCKLHWFCCIAYAVWVYDGWNSDAWLADVCVSGAWLLMLAGRCWLTVRTNGWLANECMAE